MWDRSSFESLTRDIGIPVEVDWDKKPSTEKHGKVNMLLAILLYFLRQGCKILDLDGGDVSSLTIHPMKRRLTDNKKRAFTIVGHSTGCPLLLVDCGSLVLEVYFNYHLFVEAETTYRQYFPSASLIVRCRNFLQSTIVASPGSWGSDIIGMTYDWEGTLIMESSQYEMTGKTRKNFRGYKLVPSCHKYFVTYRQPPKKEIIFLQNNGFESIIVGKSPEECIPRINRAVRIFVKDLERRL